MYPSMQFGWVCVDRGWSGGVRVCRLVGVDTGVVWAGVCVWTEGVRMGGVHLTDTFGMHHTRMQFRTLFFQIGPDFL